MNQLKNHLLCIAVWLKLILPTIVLLLLTVVAFHRNRTFSQYREKNLDRIVSSLRPSTLVNDEHQKRFESTSLPVHFTEAVQRHLSQSLDRYLIIGSETGIGNRIQTIVSGFLMAIITNRRLVIYWPVTPLSGCEYHNLFEPQTLLSSSLLNVFSRDYILQNSEHITFHGPFDELLCHSNFTNFKQKSKFLFLMTDEYFMTVLLKNPYYAQTLFRDIDEDLLFKNFVKHLFVPAKQMSDRIRSEMEKNGQCHVGIHIRKYGLKRLSINNEKLFLDCALNKTTATNQTWFIASDHVPYKTYIQQHAFENHIKVNSLNISDVDTSRCESVQHAIVELLLLSKCQQLVLTALSSFGWMVSGMTGIHPTIVSDSSCHVQSFSHPCYYELTHTPQLSCFNYKTMLTYDKCCQTEGFCRSNCLHHSPKGGSHSFFFLLIWPLSALFKWFMKWTILLCVLIYLLNRFILKFDIDVLKNAYIKLGALIILISIVFIDIRCILWSFIRVL